MSKQPYTARQYREQLAAKGVMIPAEKGDPKQLWILVRMDPTDEVPGCFFVTHGANFDKFMARDNCDVIGHSWDRTDLTNAARRATEVCGPSYQPKFSVKPGSDVQPRPSVESEGDDLDWSESASRLTSSPRKPDNN